MKLEIITSFYNPMNYRNLRNNYWKFRQELNHDLTTIELSFNGQFEIEDSVQIEGNASNVMWQKERLLNIAIERSDADAVCWVDADLLFTNPNWIDELKETLKKFPVVQPFQNFIDLDADGNEIRNLPGYAWGRFQDISGYHRPGGIWAARREVLEHGLDDSQIMGGGDVLTLASFTGLWTHAIIKYMSMEWRQHSMRHAAKVYPLVRNRLGYVTGDAYHLYHGSLKNRDYVGRWKRLTDYNFNPETDIEIDSNGLWKWTDSAHPEMIEKVAAYFAERREDD